MSVAPAFPHQAAWRPRYRLRRVLIEAGSAILGVVLLIWSLLPVYNMFLIALDPEEGAVVAIYALLLAWSDYLYQAVLLSIRNMSVSMTQGQLFADVDAEWNAMMAAAIIYVLPPIALLFALRRYVAASLIPGRLARWTRKR
jgi:ABC-type glycerol-3-phosphate transport system permease component